MKLKKSKSVILTHEEVYQRSLDTLKEYLEMRRAYLKKEGALIFEEDESN